MMKRPRFRLLSALLLVAFIATLLGGLTALRYRLLDRLTAIEAVDRLHGTYGGGMVYPTWFHRAMGSWGVPERAFLDPVQLTLGPANMGYDPARPFCDEDLEALAEHLEHFSSLRSLELPLCPHVTDRGIAALPLFPNLEWVQLSESGVTDRGVEQLRRRYPKLEIYR